VFRFLWHYFLPVGVFSYCYARILYVIRRQNKIVSGQVHRTNAIHVLATALHAPTTERVQQLATGPDVTGDKLSRSELSVLQTMISVIVCFIVCRSAAAISNLLHLLGVSVYCL